MSAYRGSSTGIAATTVSRLAWLGSLALLGACAGSSLPDAPDQPAALRNLRAADVRVATIAYRLAAAGEAICPRKARLTGLTLHDASQYAPGLRAAARDVLGAGDRVSVLAIAPDSPAARAGVLAGDIVVSIDGFALPSVLPTATASYAAIAAAQVMLERAAVARVFTLGIERGGGIGLGLQVAPVAGCASQVQLRTSPEIEARADGRIVSVTTGLLDYVANDDELALAMAHEMAHNALGHRVLLQARGVRSDASNRLRDGGGEVLAVERIADRFGYYLMARAGYDPAVAAGFWQRLHDGPAKARRAPETHPGQAERVAHARVIAREILDKRAKRQLLIP